MCSISYLNEINGIEYPFAIFNSDGGRLDSAIILLYIF